MSYPDRPGGLTRVRPTLPALLLAALLLAALLLAACAVPPARTEYAPLSAVARGVYVQRGADEAPNPRNRGAVANLGVLVGPTGVIVVGTGCSRAHGEDLLARIERLAGRPVVLAIDPQASPDQVLGNGAFLDRGVTVLAHRQTDLFMREHCEACIADVRSSADTPELAASHPAWPTRLVDGGMELEAGGRRLRLLHYGWTEQPGSLAVLDLQSGVLFTGDMASAGMVPQAQLSNLQGWIGALSEMRALAPVLVVPAHGPPGPAAVLDDTAGYLGALQSAVAEAYRRGDGLLETVRALELPAYRSWPLYDVNHRRNVQHAYLQVEAERMGR